MKLKSWITLSLFSLVVLVGSALSNVAWAGTGVYLLVWTSDRGNDGSQDPDFLAVIDADPSSSTYGKIVNTASLPCISGANLLDELGIAPGVSSCILNEAHHFSSIITDPVTQHRYLYTGGLISANVFRFDVTDPLNIPTATLVITSRDVVKFAGTDDINLLPNGNLISTFMGSKGLTTPGGLVEFTPSGTVVAEYDAARAGGPTRYVPSINNVTDTGLLAHPHGIGIRTDLGLVVTSDYADPFSLASSTPSNLHQDLGTTVRIWNLSNLAAGPQKIIQVPDGPRVESVYLHEEPEGLMAMGLTNQAKHKGMFTTSMCGGVLYYMPDITAANPQFREVYDFGPCTGASLFDITSNDRYLVIALSGIQSPGDPIYNRDYTGEHSRRVAVFDLKALLAKGNNINNIQCGPPPVSSIVFSGGFTTLSPLRNNGAADCPVLVSELNMDSADNFATHGGPHELTLDNGDSRVAVADYFVQLTEFGLPGTGSDGDHRVCIANFSNGVLTMDTNFKDELTGDVCVNFNRPTTYYWPNRGYTGNAKPHDIEFIHKR